MRISTDQTDPGYSNWEKIKHQDITVLRDGIEIPGNCLLTADEEEGMMVRYMRHDNTGELVMYDGEPVTMLEYGKVEIIVADRPYDAATEVRKHQEDVSKLLERIIIELHQRAVVHDDSKYSDEELPHLQKMGEITQREGQAMFGTPEYEARKAILAPMLDHHYANNDHHLQHYPGGICEMNLLAVVEMFADICASGAARNPEGVVDLDIATLERQGIPPQLGHIFRNTAKALGITLK